MSDMSIEDLTEMYDYVDGGELNEDLEKMSEIYQKQRATTENLKKAIQKYIDDRESQDSGEKPADFESKDDTLNEISTKLKQMKTILMCKNSPERIVHRTLRNVDNAGEAAEKLIQKNEQNKTKANTADDSDENKSNVDPNFQELKKIFGRFCDIMKIDENAQVLNLDEEFEKCRQAMAELKAMDQYLTPRQQHDDAHSA